MIPKQELRYQAAQGGKNVAINHRVECAEQFRELGKTMADPEKTVVLPGTMPDRLPETARAPKDFNPIAVAKELLRATRAGALAPIDRNTGHPFSSLVNVATDADGSPIILASQLSPHTANIEVDLRASVLLASTGKGDPLSHPRLTVIGAFANIERDAPDAARVRRRFLSRHPKSRLYAGFGDFSFWRLRVASAHVNGGFARAADLKASDIITSLEGAAEIVEIEQSAVEHMNADHPDAVRLYATQLLGEGDGAWEVTGVDPDGLDLALGDRVARMPFAQRVTNALALRKTLAEWGARARAQSPDRT
jgi:putative heme iron utilization protein